MGLPAAKAVCTKVYEENGSTRVESTSGVFKIRFIGNGGSSASHPVLNTVEVQEKAGQDWETVGNGGARTVNQAVESLCGQKWAKEHGYLVYPAGFAPPTGQAAQDSALADVNGDGIPDRLSLTASGVTVELVAADGSILSTAQFPTGFSPEPGSSEILTADFNGDGKPDIAVSNYGDNPATPGVAILPGHGDGTFGAPQFVAAGQAGQFVQSIAAADFRGIGKIDLAVSLGSTILILAGNGNGTFQAPVSYSVPKGAQSLLALDLNGDGLPDLATAGGGFVSVLLNSGGHFGQPVTTAIPFAANEQYYLAYTDLDRDGKLDLIAACLNSNALVVLFGKGDGTFRNPAAYAVGSGPDSLGVLPLVDGTILYTGDATTGDTILTVVGPQGNVQATPYNFAGGAPTGIAAADLNGDQQFDVVVVGGASDVSVAISQGGTTFQPPVGYSLGPSSPGPLAVAIDNLNGDRKPDVIVANAAGSVSVLLGNGDGTLRAPITTMLPNRNAQSLALGDFNHDGNVDVAVAAFGTQSGATRPDDGAVLVLLGQGDGTFQAPVALTVSGLHPVAVAAADLNGDGNLDLAASMAGNFNQPTTLAVFLGDGAGGFAAARTFPLRTTGNYQGGIAIGDLNGDGKPDIAVVNANGIQPVDILLGDGAGGFREMATLPATEYGPVALVMAAIGGTDKQDLVIAHCCGQTDATYLLGNGDGTFQAERHFIGGGSPTALALARFSGSTGPEGPDLVVADATGTWISLLNNFVLPALAAPASGSGASQTFTFTVSDSAGYQDLSVVDVLINNALDGRHACYVAFAPSSASSGSLFLVDDAGDAAGPYQGLVLPGSGTVSNSQCTISAPGSSVSASGNTLTLTLAITFSAAFAGNQVFYLSAQGASITPGWQAAGTWRIPGAAVSGPSVSGMSPGYSSAVGPLTCTFTFTDTNGWQDIAVANILVNSAIDGRQACYLAFAPASRSLFLVDDAGDAGGPYSGTVIPGSGTVSNSQCTAGGPGSTFTGSGNTLTLTLPIAFTEAFAGNQIFFLAARSNTVSSGWQAVGSVSVP